MKISRRKFIKRTGLIGASAFLSSYFVPEKLLAHLNPGPPDISIIEGTDYFKNTVQAVDAIGGIKRFVAKKDIVGILINADFEEQGTFVNPDIAAAVINMCYQAGAKEVIILQGIPDDYWDRTGNLEKHKKTFEKLSIITANKFPTEFEEENWVKAGPFPGAVSLQKEAEMVKRIFEVDTFINIPIAKHHATTLYTGALKNTMGLCTRKTNVGMHLDSGVRNDPVYLAQCIVDLNLVRKADLIVVDATEVIVTNGPSGPGELAQHNHIVAGTDIVAVDALCGEYAGFSPDEILTTQIAHDMGQGEKDVSKLVVMKMAGV